jgi:hypothetical protein
MSLDAAQRAEVPAYTQKSGSGIRSPSSAGSGTLRYRVGTLIVAARTPSAGASLPRARDARLVGAFTDATR